VISTLGFAGWGFAGIAVTPWRVVRPSYHAVLACWRAKG
jgi:hypothetical protein